MKLLTWNCQMALHKKLEPLLRLQPDLAVIPEMASPAKLGTAFQRDCGFNLEWTGHTETKGLGVLINPDWDYRIADSYRSEFELFLPIEIHAPVRFNVLAVWAFNHRAKAIAADSNRTVDVLKHYAAWIASAPTLVMGDFNNSVVWDRPGKPTNFDAIQALLGELGLCSLYHSHFNQAFGDETAPTLCMRKDKTAPYHVDYLFMPDAWLPDCVTFQMGAPNHWLQYSDHVPMAVELLIP
ncbi:MAG: endonuclease/exonuclease/phosphatase family protein [Motiliproteus sp.]|nr:endonuclease/exonuclease/phosphatase family protein [Motiliproteus sp.]MCW9053235.1 endonuclease/exonuclease/phosphatase family protein [Motiliproteus sp.]